MAYYLTVDSKKEHKLLDISSLPEFVRLSNFKGNSYSIEEIDGFTSTFEDEVSLKSRLYEVGLISKEEILKDISIRSKYNGNLNKVMYGLVYKNNKGCIDAYKLRKIFLRLHRDRLFLNKFLNQYRSNYNQEYLNEIRALLQGLYINYNNMYNALSNFFMDEIVEQDKETGEAKIKYRKLHDLGMFVYNYLSKKGKSNEELYKTEQIKNEKLKELQKSLTIEKPVYVRKKIQEKKYDLDGQTSFF